jgi:glycosyltransferase involved in cell wall biosynthesis
MRSGGKPASRRESSTPGAGAGDSAARNTGLSATSSDLVLFLDHDDILLPEAIERHIAAFSSLEGTDAATVFGSNHLIDYCGVRQGSNSLERRVFSWRDVVLGTTPSFSQCMYRRSALERIGGFHPQAGSSADHDLNIRLLAEGTGLCHGEFVMSYRLHSGQQTKSPSRLYWSHMAVLDRHLGAGGVTEDSTLLEGARRHWKGYYGQYMLSEAGGMLLARRFR